MTCESCGKPKCNCGKDTCSTGAAVVIKNATEYVNFRKVLVPASVRSDETNPPKPGEFCNTLLVFEATGNAYLYSSDGIPTQISDRADIRRLEKLIADEAKTRETEDGKLEDAILHEGFARVNADDAIWQEIETIEASSDVVDVVGTYAELEAYDTSKLHDKDLIKVLQDETHDDAITYYRWSTSTDTFTYVGAEGPYYTCSETDVLLSGKQDTLIAGANIQIAADGKTISATDTTYSDFTGATALADGAAGLVPAPATTDVDKYLKGDGTWGTVQTGATVTTFYWNGSAMYKDSGFSTAATMSDVETAANTGPVKIYFAGLGRYEYLVADNISNGDYFSTVYTAANGRLRSVAYTYSSNTWSRSSVNAQEELTAGANITIGADGVTISATDTTYSAFGGATSQIAGSAGLVPAPTTSDPDKFLKGDGTWGTPVGKVYTAGTNIDISVNDVISVTGMPVLYTTQGQNEDGAVTQKLFTDTVGDIETILQILNSGAGVP